MTGNPDDPVFSDPRGAHKKRPLPGLVEAADGRQYTVHRDRSLRRAQPKIKGKAARKRAKRERRLEREKAASA